jgi:hypothetical protein
MRLPHYQTGKIYMKIHDKIHYKEVKLSGNEDTTPNTEQSNEADSGSSLIMKNSAYVSNEEGNGADPCVKDAKYDSDG